MVTETIRCRWTKMGVDMKKTEFPDWDELRCEEKCVYEWVDCEEELEGSAICKTRERGCIGDCS